MAITPNGTTATKDASSLGCVRSIILPERAVKEVDITCLDSTIETFTTSNLQSAQEMTLVRLIDPEVMDVAEGDSGAFVITFPKQTSGSAAAMNWAFSGVVLSVATSDLGAADDAAIEETLTIRLTTVVTVTNEA